MSFYVKLSSYLLVTRTGNTANLRPATQQREKATKKSTTKNACVRLPAIYNPPKEDFYLFFAHGTNKLIVCELTKRKKHMSKGTITTAQYTANDNNSLSKTHIYIYTMCICRRQ